MHPIFHVVISFIIGLGVGLHYKFRYRVILLSAIVINLMIDSDVFLVRYGFTELRIFQTSLAMIYAPLLLLLSAHLYEKGGDKSILTRISLMVVLIGFSHLVLDTFTQEPVYLYYPFSQQEFAMAPQLIPFVLLFFGLLVFLVNIIESYLYYSVDKETVIDKGRVRFLIPSFYSRFRDVKDDLER